jgi:hypothetical protein
MAYVRLLVNGHQAHILAQRPDHRSISRGDDWICPGNYIRDTPKDALDPNCRCWSTTVTTEVVL